MAESIEIMTVIATTMHPDNTTPRCSKTNAEPEVKEVSYVINSSTLSDSCEVIISTSDHANG